MRPAHSVGAALAVLLLASMAGCSALAVYLGLRVRLDNIPVTAITASLVDKHGAPVVALGPGQSARLVVTASAGGGKQYVTVGAGHGKVAFDNYTIEPTVAAVDKRGTVSLSSDPRLSEGKVAHLHIVTVAHPGVSADLDIAVRYDIAFSVDFSGSDGMHGADGLAGSDGMSGSDGTPGTTDPVTGLTGNPGPGGRGSDGGNGGDGGNGQNGKPGESVHVWVRMSPGTSPLLQIKVQGSTRQSLYLVDPHGGSLRITTNGGHGGRGGQGGRGGRGGSGGNGFPNGSSGLDGRPGFDGRPGSGGAAGTIAMVVDPATQPFLNCISWSNHSGDGAPGASPTITVAPVAPLW